MEWDLDVKRVYLYLGKPLIIFWLLLRADPGISLRGYGITIYLYENKNYDQIKYL